MISKCGFSPSKTFEVQIFNILPIFIIYSFRSVPLKQKLISAEPEKFQWRLFADSNRIASSWKPNSIHFLWMLEYWWLTVYSCYSLNFRFSVDSIFIYLFLDFIFITHYVYFCTRICNSGYFWFISNKNVSPMILQKEFNFNLVTWKLHSLAELVQLHCYGNKWRFDRAM